MSNQPILTQAVEIELGGETRTIQIERFSPNHVWHTKTPIIVRFPTGDKRHTLHFAQVYERNGKWTFGGTQSFRNRNNARPVAFAETVSGNSGWTPNEVR